MGGCLLKASCVWDKEQGMNSFQGLIAGYAMHWEKMLKSR